MKTTDKYTLDKPLDWVQPWCPETTKYLLIGIEAYLYDTHMHNAFGSYYKTIRRYFDGLEKLVKEIIDNKYFGIVGKEIEDNYVETFLNNGVIKMGDVDVKKRSTTDTKTN